MKYLVRRPDTIVGLSDGITVVDTADPNRKDLVFSNGDRYNGVDWTVHNILENDSKFTAEESQKIRANFGKIKVVELGRLASFSLPTPVIKKF